MKNVNRGVISLFLSSLKQVLSDSNLSISPRLRHPVVPPSRCPSRPYFTSTPGTKMSEWTHPGIRALPLEAFLLEVGVFLPVYSSFAAHVLRSGRMFASAKARFSVQTRFRLPRQDGQNIPSYDMRRCVLAPYLRHKSTILFDDIQGCFIVSRRSKLRWGSGPSRPSRLWRGQEAAATRDAVDPCCASSNNMHRTWMAQKNPGSGVAVARKPISCRSRSKNRNTSPSFCACEGVTMLQGKRGIPPPVKYHQQPAPSPLPLYPIPWREGRAQRETLLDVSDGVKAARCTIGGGGNFDNGRAMRGSHNRGSPFKVWRSRRVGGGTGV